MKPNKRKHKSPLNTSTKAIARKNNSKGYPKTKSKSKSKEKDTESSSSKNNISSHKKASKEKISKEIFNIKDITEKLGNSKIFCRDDEKKEILKFIQTKEKNKKTLFISGQPGTGKTSLVAEIFNEDLINDDNYFLKFSINCLSINSTDDFYEAVFKYLNNPNFYNFFIRIFEEKKHKNIINLLKEAPCQNSFSKLLNLLNKTTFTMVLDEIDFLYKKKDSYLFFSLLSIPYLINSDIKMILISNNADFDNEIFPKLKNRKITIQKIVFKPYTHKQLSAIMNLKLEKIGLSKYFSSDAIRFLSTKMNKSGDIRPIISIIKELILNNKNKIQNKIDFKIELKDMFDIIKKKNITLNEILSSMTTEQKIVVAAIYYVCKNNGAKFEEKILFDKYKNIKNYTNTPVLNTEEFRDILKTFVDVGLIESTSSFGKGRKKMTIVYKVKYTDDDLSLIFEDPMIFGLFNVNQEEEDQKVQNEKEK